MDKKKEISSVGIIKPKTVDIKETLKLDCGKVLDGFKLIYETYGQLNPEKNNAILICHALSGDHHAAGYHSKDDKKPGWWDSCIGPGKPFDTNKLLIITKRAIESSNLIKENIELRKLNIKNYELIGNSEFITDHKTNFTWSKFCIGIEKFSRLL